MYAVYRKEISLATLPYFHNVAMYHKGLLGIKNFFLHGLIKLSNILDSHTLSMKLTMLFTVNVYSFFFHD